MNRPWKRTPRSEENFKDHRIEDLFMCHKCSKSWPWFLYVKGAKLALDWIGDNPADHCEVYRFMNDDEDRGGRQWACDYCVENTVVQNSIVTIHNEHGEIIQ